MIQEDVSPAVSVGEQASSAKTLDETSVAAQDRYARHGHYPAVVLLENRPALEARLERLLFDLGFEALHVSGSEFSADTFAKAARLAHSAGLIVLYSGDVLARETKQSIAADFDNRFFDLASAPELHADEELATRQVITLAQSEWRVEPRKTQDKVN
jgi:hypothetical protein